jgi:hypothetical protein
MLPYILTAGHNTYGVCIPLYLKEIKSLPIVAPTVFTGFLEHGDFTVRRADGCHNGVSPDMVIEKSYNADVKQKTGLTGITLNPAARTQWLYTKPITAAVSGQLKAMLNTCSDTTGTTSSRSGKCHRCERCPRC